MNNVKSILDCRYCFKWKGAHSNYTFALHAGKGCLCRNYLHRQLPGHILALQTHKHVHKILTFVLYSCIVIGVGKFGSNL